ncbi:regulatory protein RecX [Candidatus Dojkabacteria bacterium]|nr:regulatory protein RecX [Candidatus Dojkabacteria bacterium]
MIITEIVPQAKNPNRFNVYLDGKFAFGASINTVADHKLYDSLKISESELSTIINSELFEKLYERCVKYLAKMIRTREQVRQYISNLFFKNRKKWFSDTQSVNENEIADKVITRLLEAKLLNDRYFAQAFIEDRVANKPRGRRLIFSELFSKGISQTLAEEVWNELEIDEMTLLKAVYQKKFGNKKFDSSDQKTVRFLLSKGFDWDDIENLG